MALAEDVQRLANRTISALDSSHDYFTYTKRVWRLLEQVAKEGRRLTFQNRATRSRMSERALVEIAPLYISQ
jgi:hypothetical protein